MKLELFWLCFLAFFSKIRGIFEVWMRERNIEPFDCAPWAQAQEKYPTMNVKYRREGFLLLCRKVGRHRPRISSGQHELPYRQVFAKAKQNPFYERTRGLYRINQHRPRIELASHHFPESGCNYFASETETRSSKNGTSEPAHRNSIFTSVCRASEV